MSGGPHSFGWMQNVDGHVQTRKFPGRIDDQLEKLYSIKRDCDWFVGHVRWATHGDSSNLNNVHPILHNNILGVHNGVLKNHEAVLKECGGRMNDSTEVDSEAIFAAVAHFGHVNGLAKLYGSMVAVYTDLDKPEAIYVARSQVRMLRIGWTKRGNMIFASEQRALDALEEAGIEFDGFSGVAENRILKIQSGQIKDRTTYRVPATSFPARKAVVRSRKALIADAAAEEAQTSANRLGTALEMSYNNSVASRRGGILFPDAQIRPHHNETTKPKKRKAREVGRIVGNGKVKYKGHFMTQDEYLKLRSEELASAMVDDDEDNWED